MSSFARWSEEIEGWLDRASYCSALLASRDEDWRLATGYAFNLMTELFQKRGILVPNINRHLVIATVLLVATIAVWLAFITGALEFTLLAAAIAGLPLLAVLWLYQPYLAMIGLPPKRTNTFLVIGALAVLGAQFVARNDSASLITSRAAETMAQGLALLVFVICLVACLLSWARTDNRYRVNALAMLSPARPRVDQGNKILLSMINVANAVSQLRKAHSAGPKSFAEVRRLLGSTPGQMLLDNHPLELTDQRFETDLQMLLAGQIPPMQPVP